MAVNKKIHGLGRRKKSVVQVLLTKDNTDKFVNKIPFETYFETISMRQNALMPLELSSQLDVYGFKAKIGGGGKSGQARALQLAIARALVSVDAGYRKQMRDAGLLTRDPRMKERKKPGLKRARRAPQFSKR